MKYSVLGWVSVFAMATIPVVGCSDESAGAGGSGGDGGTAGTDGSGGAASQVFPCTEEGIRDAIAVGGGPHTFACDGPTTVVTEAQIVIDNDVILDGEGNLTVDGNDDHRVFSVLREETVELWGFAVTRGRADGQGGGIANVGTLTLTNSTVSGNSARAGGGITSYGTLMLTNSTVSGNTAEEFGGGILYTDGTNLMLTNSTVSGNTAEFGGGIFCTSGTIALTNSTVSGNRASAGGGIVAAGAPKGPGPAPRLTLTDSTVSGNTADRGGGIACEIADCTIVGSLVDGDCVGGDFGDITSNGYNIESPGDTCGFDQPTDQVSVGTDDLKLGPLQDNGGPTETHALDAGSVAIDQIPAEDCVDADGDPLTTDQRAFPRDSMCDVGAFEVQEGSL